jgi:hypothetical protein
MVGLVLEPGQADDRKGESQVAENRSQQDSGQRYFFHDEMILGKVYGKR